MLYVMQANNNASTWSNEERGGDFSKSLGHVSSKDVITVDAPHHKSQSRDFGGRVVEMS